MWNKNMDVIKPYGIGTDSLVMGSSMVFTHLSSIVDPSSTSKTDVGIVTNIGSLRFGVLLKGEFVDENNVK